MKIKDIRQFRSLIKKQIAEIDLPSRNENYIGVSQEIRPDEFEYGFFSIYHGLKSGYQDNDGVRGFLQGFLDMAKDGQAVYEFMQNAVDAISTKFCLFWGKDEVDGNHYLLVANNGRMFNADAVQSILNIGVSTKAADNYTIGKFGIGFKLAHRLVGRENGLDELLNENYGPVLFSWGNHELQALADMRPETEVIPVAQQYRVFVERGKRKAEVPLAEPWLFKILITNFPCQPENSTVPEFIRDYRYNEKPNAFSKAELAAMSRWVKKYQACFSEDYREGALFFIKLGQGKQGSLEETNLEEGVRFSMTILNRTAKQTLGHPGLNEINLNGTQLLPVPLEFEPFYFEKGTELFRQIRFGKADGLTEDEITKEKLDSDIEVLMGFTDHRRAKDTFKNAPNFYLFFPLSEEKHRLCFILHSNAFYKSSSRTYLQKGTTGDEGINERLFRAFSTGLSMRMATWASSADEALRSRFLNVYATLLLSRDSDNPERMWINEPLWEPLLALIKQQIPVKTFNEEKFALHKNATQVKIKSTTLPVDTESWLGTEVKWFYWEERTDHSLCNEAGFKAGIERMGILDILKHKDVWQRINLWIAQDTSRIQLIITELENFIAFVDTKSTGSEIFKENFSKLNIWQFSNGTHLSIDTIDEDEAGQQYFLLYDRIDELKHSLLKAGSYVSELTLSNYQNLLKYIQTTSKLVKYLNDYSYLISLLSNRYRQADFEPSEKKHILSQVARFKYRGTEDRIEKIREFYLFSNRNGLVVPLKQLTASTSFTWLSPWSIKESEYSAELDDYLTDEAGLYQHLIIPHWDAIAGREGLSHKLLPEIYKEITTLYLKDPKAPTLSDQKIILTQGGLISAADGYFYCQSLNDLSAGEYETFAGKCGLVGIAPLPAKDMLAFYAQAPFKLETCDFAPTLTEPRVISDLFAAALFRIATKENRELFDILTVSGHDGNLMLFPADETIRQASCPNELTALYIKKYHGATFHLLPPEFKGFEDLIYYKQDVLVSFLSELLEGENEEQQAELLEIAAQAGHETRLLTLNRLSKQTFNLDAPFTTNAASVRFIALVLSTIADPKERNKIIRDKIIVNYTNEKYVWDEVTLTGNNEVSLTINDIVYRLSLAAILPNDRSRATQIAGLLAEALSGIGVGDRKMLEECLGLGAQTDPAYILRELSAQQPERELLNADQLAFLLLMAAFDGSDLSLSDFLVSTLAGPVAIEQQVWYAPGSAPAFIPAENVLTACYAGIETILQLKPGQTFRIVGLPAIVHSPSLIGNSFSIPGIDRIESGKQQQTFEFLFSLFKQAEPQPHSLILENGKAWEDLIGFDPAVTIAEENWAYNHEKLSKAVNDWLVDEKESKIQFLSALGVSFSDSTVVIFRQYLSGKIDNEHPMAFVLPGELLINSLKFVTVRNVSFKLGDRRTATLIRLYLRLADTIEPRLLPLPAISTSQPGEWFLTDAQNCTLLQATDQDGLSPIDFPLSRLNAFSDGPVLICSMLPIEWTEQLSTCFNSLIFIFDKPIIDNEMPEWQRLFYREWKKTYPQYTIRASEHSVPRTLLINGKDAFTYYKGDLAFNNDHVVLNGTEADKKLISLMIAEKALPDEALALLAALQEEFELTFEDYVNKIQSNEQLKEEWERLQKKLQEESARRKLSEDFGNTTRYTMEWFTKLLDLMVIAAEGNGYEQPKGTITFKKLTYDLTDKRILGLVDPSSPLSPNIEFFSDFNATFSFEDQYGRKRSRSMGIKGVTRKGQRLYVLPSNAAEVDAIPLDKVFTIQISFTRRIALIKELRNAFNTLAFPPEYHLKNELTAHINFIFGPPGTGKTTHIATQIFERMEKDPQTKILVLTPTNKSADVLAKRLLKIDKEAQSPPFWLVRYGTSNDADLNDMQIVRDSNSYNFDPGSGVVLITTIHRFPYERVVISRNKADEVKLPIADIDWHTIVFDEASMIMLPAIIYPLFKRRYRVTNAEMETEFIIGGDPFQIPPIFDIKDEDLPEQHVDVKEENIYTLVELNAFVASQQHTVNQFGHTVTNLGTQYRSVTPVGKIFSRFQYNDQLLHGRELGLNKDKSPKSRALPDYFKALGFKPVTVIRYPVNQDDPVYDPKRLNGSPFQLYSAFLVNELIRRFRIEAANKEEWNIGVVCPYRAQANLVNTMIENQENQPAGITVTTDTVHGFQGDESEILFALFNPGSVNTSYSRFFKKKFIINVAISRAEDYLIVLLPEKLWGLPLLDQSYPGSLLQIINALEESTDVALLKAVDLEEKIMGRAGFFADESFISEHDEINVYGEPERDYMVRLSRWAMDIHWKKR